MESQIEQVLEGRLQQAHAKIEALAGALTELQDNQEKAQEKMTSDMNQLRDEQLFAKQKLQEVENSVASSGNAIISQMGQMFASMQASLEQTLVQRYSLDPEKRQRLEEPVRNDPFATKS